MKLTPSQRRSLLALLLVLAVVAVVFLVQQNRSTSPGGVTTSVPAPTSFSTNAVQARDTLSKLPVIPTKTNASYKRTDFGTAWADVDKNSCDTRNDILNRDLSNKKMKDACTVLEGDLQDPYTGKQIHFVRGNGALVDIDHVVSLGNAAVTGGDKLTADQKLHIANDPENLLSVDASANRQKGDSDASEWLPPNKAFQCTYVEAQIHIKDKYKLSVTKAEKATMEQVLATCK